MTLQFSHLYAFTLYRRPAHESRQRVCWKPYGNRFETKRNRVSRHRGKKYNVRPFQTDFDLSPSLRRQRDRPRSIRNKLPTNNSRIAREYIHIYIYVHCTVTAEVYARHIERSETSALNYDTFQRMRTRTRVCVVRFVFRITQNVCNAHICAVHKVQSCRIGRTRDTF